MSDKATVITTVSNSQRDILQAIRDLHNHGEHFQVDLTYGKGKFWYGADRPVVRMDRFSTDPGVNLVADVRHLPFRDGSLRSVVFDPPFLHAAGARSLMGQRFGSYRSQRDLWYLYRQAIFRIGRALAPDGLFVFKCQDVVESGRQVWTHIRVADYAQRMGLVMEDLFILTRRSAMVGWNHRIQRHARKTHCYFLVFRRPGR